MIDFGLLASMIIAVGLPSLVVRWWPLRTYSDDVGVLDIALGPGFVALGVGRLTALILDDPQSIGRVADMLIIRSGVEFWPGVIAAAGLLAWMARRSGVSPLSRLGAVAPLALIGYGGYEAACIFRHGCFGPESPVGMRPVGLVTTMLPMGLVVATAVAVGAAFIRGLSRPAVVVTAAVLMVATARSVASIWLPHVGEGLTRQHLTSIVVMAVFAVVVAVQVVIRSVRSGSPSPDLRRSTS